jgi:hypothetical protein
MGRALPFHEQTLDELSIGDEPSFRHVALYADLKEILRRGKYVFRVLPDGPSARWDRALFLNLTYWGAAGGDVLECARISADVVAHVAWHHLAALAFAGATRSAESLFLGESIATAFDVYLVGRLLGHTRRSSFLETQVPAMAEAAEAAGLSSARFKRLMKGVAADPERSFADLRALLFEATIALDACDDASAALVALERFDAHRFGPLLHHYELSNWVLYARAHGAPGPDPRARAIEKALRAARSPLAWLEAHWVAPALRFR